VAADLDLSQLPDFENVVLTGSGSFNVIGNSLANKIQGNRGDNVLDGGVGKDNMAGGAGNDTYYVDDNGDIVKEEAGNGLSDLVISSLNSYALGDAIENLQLIGGDGSAGTGNIAPNLIIGSASNNFLKGGDGDDTLIGGLGDDTLQGDTDSNSLVGGEGDDLYIVNFQGDKIIDSEGDNDKIFLRPNIDAVVRANEDAVTVITYGASSISFDPKKDTVMGGGAEIFLSLDQLRNGDLFLCFTARY
jgi:Ca2+-binding RTX toxin-like protein